MEPQEVELSALGTRLVSGEVRVVGRSERADGWCALQLTSPGMAPSLRQELALRLAAHGRSSKQIAADLRVCISTVSADLGAGLDRMGLMRHEIGLLHEVDRCAGCSDRGATVYWMPLAARLPEGLSPAEREIAKAILEGLSNREISEARGRSLNTVANQVASVFRRLGISSRAELFAGVWLSAVAPPPCNGQISLAS